MNVSIFSTHHCVANKTYCEHSSQPQIPLDSDPFKSFKLVSLEGAPASQAWKEANGLKASDLQSVASSPHPFFFLLAATQTVSEGR